MSNDARCTLPHDPMNADRDMPCYYCITYGHVTEPRVSMDLRRDAQSRRKVMVRRDAMRRREDAQRLQDAQDILAANQRRMALIAELLKLREENARLRRAQ